MTERNGGERTHGDLACGPDQDRLAASLTIRPTRFHLPRPAFAEVVTRPSVGGVEPFCPDRIRPRPDPYRAVEPATLAVHRQTVDGRTQVGVLAEVAVADYDRGRIRPHESTRPHVVRALVDQWERGGVDLSPVTLAFRADAGLASAITERHEAGADLQFVAEDGAEHAVWLLDAVRAGSLAARLARRPALYVVDGHHRCAAASRLAARQTGGHGDGSTGASAHLFALLVGEDQLAVTSFHVIVRQVASTPPETVARVGQRLGAAPQVVGARAAARTRPGTITMWCGGRWYRFRSARRDPAGDAALLQSVVLAPAFGIVRSDDDVRLDHMPGTVAPHELERRCPPGSVAFVLHPPTVAELFAAADAGTSVPPKSSFFHPKVPTGLFLRSRR